MRRTLLVCSSSKYYENVGRSRTLLLDQVITTNFLPVLKPSTILTMTTVTQTEAIEMGLEGKTGLIKKFFLFNVLSACISRLRLLNIHSTNVYKFKFHILLLIITTIMKSVKAGDVEMLPLYHQRCIWCMDKIYNKIHVAIQLAKK